MGDPNHSWDATTVTLELGPVQTIVGTIVQLGRNMISLEKRSDLIRCSVPPLASPFIMQHGWLKLTRQDISLSKTWARFS